MTTIPSKTRLDYEAYAAIPYDGKRHEIIDGEHFVNPPPSPYHQEIIGALHFQLYAKVKNTGLGFVYLSPVAVHMSDNDVFEPDLVVIRKQNKHIKTPTKIKGVPDLLIEVLSPTNPGHDLDTKRKAYGRCGVSEYWIVDPDEHSVLKLILHGSVYKESGEFHNEITFNVPPPIQINLLEVW